jgi:hypothetical protein
MIQFVLACSFLMTGCYPAFETRPPEYVHPKPEMQQQRPAIVYIPTDSPNMRYIVDVKRRLCFFQIFTYGQQSVTQIDCASIPETSEIFGEEMQPEQQPPEEQQQMEEPQSQTTTGEKPIDVTDQDRQLYSQVYIDIFCLVQKGQPDEEQIKAIYEKHGLDKDRYNALGDVLMKDKAFWDQLSGEAVSRCGQTPPQNPPQK